MADKQTKPTPSINPVEAEADPKDSTNGSAGTATAATHNETQSTEENERQTQPVFLEDPPRLAFAVVGIGASAGGLEAFLDFLSALSPETGMAFVFIQHLAPDRQSLMDEILSRRTRMRVSQITDGQLVEPNNVYVIRPGFTVTIKRGKLHLAERTTKPGHTRPVDDFFKSLAEEQRERSICIVMSGMGSNGTAGAQAVKAVGGLCIAQDPESAQFPSMPRHLIDAGYADYILQPRDIPDVIVGFANHPYALGDEATAEMMLRREQHHIREILAVLRTRTHQDFAGYKKPTVLRRIQRRMGLGRLTDIGEYARILRQSPTEVESLADDLLIHVTGFFRDAVAWETLRERVIVPLIAGRDGDQPVRCWVTACSSGEEAYTLAMLLVEEAERVNKPVDIKVFATDMAARSLQNARHGIYPGGIESEITPARLSRFFERDDAIYRVRPDLRERVIFAPQNLLQDPPFSRIDIASCRNLLIYLEPEVQKRVLSMLHFGVRDGGALFLGSSETVSGSEDLFEPLDKKAHIFRRIGPTRHGTFDFPPPRPISGLAGSNGGNSDRARSEIRIGPRPTMAQLTQRALLEHHTPVAITIDRESRIVYFHGDTSPFLNQPRGEATRDVFSLVRDNIRGAVRTALQRAIARNEAVTVLDGTIERPTGERVRIAVTAAPLDGKEASDHWVISFDERGNVAEEPSAVTEKPAATRDEDAIELRQMRGELQRSNEELQTSIEELRASNEEVMSVNEELQSANEELETSKEEMQSLNEELATVNAQLQAKMEDLQATTNDLSSLLTSTDIAVIFLDTHLRIRRFTPSVRELVELIRSDIGRPMVDLAQKFTDPTLVANAEEVLAKLIPLEREVEAASGKWFLRRILPYRTADNRIDGVVITFVDITERKRGEKTREMLSAIVESSADAIIGFDLAGQIRSWNFAAERLFGYAESEAKNFNINRLCPDELQTEQASILQQLQSGKTIEQLDTVCLGKGGRRIDVAISFNLAIGTDSTRLGSAIIRDMTDRKREERELRQAKDIAENANQTKDDFLAAVSHELRTPLSAILLWANILREKNISDADLRSAVESILHSAESQKGLIDDLLDTARINAGTLRLQLRRFDLVTAIREAINSIEPDASAKTIDVRFKMTSSVVVMADPDRFRQIILNLLTNAVKFSPHGTEISVGAAQRNRIIEIHVTDHGTGIAAELLPHIFERFRQGDPTITRGQAGLGLGLTITKQLVELHGGRIEASSPGAGLGSTFKVTLPIAEPNSPSQGDAKTFVDPEQNDGPVEDATTLNLEATAFGSLSGRILLVEDDLGTRSAMKAVLKLAGAAVLVADSAAEGFEQFVQEQPDLILSDIGMPGEDGYSMLRRIRQREKEMGVVTPVTAIAVSAFSSRIDRQRAIEAGYQHHLGKPVDVKQLVAVLKALMPAVD